MDCFCLGYLLGDESMTNSAYAKTPKITLCTPYVELIHNESQQLTAMLTKAGLDYVLLPALLTICPLFSIVTPDIG